MRRADSALYWAKEYGKNQTRVYRPDVVEIAELKRLAAGPDRAARFRAAASLAKAVDARDAYTGSHSERVSDLAARIATRLGVDREQIELTRLAASLHDLGKLAIPEEILRKPGPLSETERLVLERHPQIGYRMLESLGVDPVADWVLHHHERWDGTGYPDALGGEDIPLGARIIFVADAYDAMTSDRVYRGRLTDDEAIAELARCSGSQFDPDVVARARGRARHRRRLAGRRGDPGLAQRHQPGSSRLERGDDGLPLAQLQTLRRARGDLGRQRPDADADAVAEDDDRAHFAVDVVDRRVERTRRARARPPTGRRRARRGPLPRRPSTSSRRRRARPRSARPARAARCRGSGSRR